MGRWPKDLYRPCGAQLSQHVPHDRATEPLCAEQHDETVIEATREAEDGWVALASEIANMTLIPRTPSWWVGGNIPGKPRLVYPFVGGLQVYRQACDDVAAHDYKGFILQGADQAAMAVPSQEARNGLAESHMIS